MPPSKNKKKKSKSKHNKKHQSTNHKLSSYPLPPQMEAEIYNDDEEYPTSRVIKRAPNGDVIVEAIPSPTDPDSQKKKGKSKSNNNTTTRSKQHRNKKPSIAATLDSHWESLSPEDKKRILRIEKDEVLEVIHKYQKDHSCSCSVCGRHHMAMDQEMERIYNMLYEIDKVKDPEINPVKFHLGIIKELQLSRSQRGDDGGVVVSEESVHSKKRNNNNNDNNSNNSSFNRNRNIITTTTTNDSDRDNIVKNFLVADNVDTLQEELMHFKQSRQLRRMNEANVTEQQQQQQLLSNAHNDTGSLSTPRPTPMVQPVVISPEEAALREKYLNFTKRFVSSHPKIAQEYVNKMMMYPDMRAVTDDLMSDSGNGFLKAIEYLMLQRPGEIETNGNGNNGNTAPHYANFGDAKSFTTMLHNGKPLTPEEYAEMQRPIADRMTNSYDARSKTFKEVSPLEKELFTRFMFGEDRQQFAEVLMQSFRNKFDTEFGGSSISASLAAAAAAATLTNPLSTTNDGSRTSFGYQGESRQGSDSVGDNEEQYCNQESDDDEDYSDSYNYSDYDDEDDDNVDDDDDSEIASDYIDENDIMSEYNDGEDGFSHHNHNHHPQQHSLPPLPPPPQTSSSSNNYHLNQMDNTTTDQLHHPGYTQTETEHFQDGLIHADQLRQHQRVPSYDENKNEYTENERPHDSYFEGEVDENDRLEEGRKLLQIAITKLLQSRIMESYNEKQADDNRMKLLQELEDEQQRKKEKEEKRQKKKEKEKEKRRLLQLAREEEKRKKAEEERRIQLETERREMERREAQRKKVEEAKRRRDEEKRRKLEEQRKREEYEEQQRKLKEEQKRKREEERKRKEEENKRRREEEQRKRKEAKRLKELEEMKKAQAQAEREKAQRKNSKGSEHKARTGSNNPPTSTGNVKTSNKKRRESLVEPKVNPKQIYVKQPSDTDVRKSLSEDIAGMISAATASQSSTMSPAHLQALLNPISNIGKTSAVSPNPKIQGSSSTFVSSTPSVFGSDKLLDTPNVLHTNTSNSSSFAGDKILPSLSGQTSPFIGGSHSAHRDPVWGPLSSSNYPSNPVVDTSTSNGMLTSTTSGGPSNIIGSGNTSINSQPDGLSFLPSLNFLLPTLDSQKKPFGEELSSLTSMLSNSSLNDTSFVINTSKSLWGEPKTSSLSSHMTPSNIGPSSLGGGLGVPLASSTTASTMVDTSMQKSSIWNNTPNVALQNSFGTTTTTTTTPSSITESDNLLAPRSRSSIDTSNYLSSNIWSHPGSFSVQFDRRGSDIQTASRYMSNTGTSVVGGTDTSLSRVIYEVYLSLVGQGHMGQFVPADLLYQSLATRGIDYTTFFNELVQMQNNNSCEIATNAAGTLSHVKIVEQQQQQVHPSMQQTPTQYLQPQTHQLFQSSIRGNASSSLMSSLFPNSSFLQDTATATTTTSHRHFQDNSLLLNVGSSHSAK